MSSLLEILDRETQVGPAGSDLAPDERLRIRHWLQAIGETDPAIIAEILDRAAADPDARRDYLARASQVPDPLQSKVLAMLRDRPEITRAWLADGDADPVRVTLAIRGVGTCELLIPGGRWSPFEFLTLIERHAGGAA